MVGLTNKTNEKHLQVLENNAIRNRLNSLKTQLYYSNIKKMDIKELFKYENKDSKAIIAELKSKRNN